MKVDRLEGWLSMFAAEIVLAANEGVFNTTEGTHTFMREKAEQLGEFLQQLEEEELQ